MPTSINPLTARTPARPRHRRARVQRPREARTEGHDAAGPRGPLDADKTGGHWTFHIRFERSGTTVSRSRPTTWCSRCSCCGTPCTAVRSSGSWNEITVKKINARASVRRSRRRSAISSSSRASPCCRRTSSRACPCRARGFGVQRGTRRRGAVPAGPVGRAVGAAPAGAYRRCAAAGSPRAPARLRRRPAATSSSCSTLGRGPGGRLPGAARWTWPTACRHDRQAARRAAGDPGRPLSARDAHGGAAQPAPEPSHDPRRAVRRRCSWRSTG